jgi:hypothetical protein
VTQREKADFWRARAAEPEIAAIIERAKMTFRGTYHEVMASGYSAAANRWEGWQGPDLAVKTACDRRPRPVAARNLRHRNSERLRKRSMRSADEN